MLKFFAAFALENKKNQIFIILAYL